MDQKKKKFNHFENKTITDEVNNEQNAPQDPRQGTFATKPIQHHRIRIQIQTG